MEKMNPYDMLQELARRKISGSRKGKIRAVLNYSTCSMSVGAGSVLKAMQEIVAEGEFDNIIIETTGCAGYCSKEPLLDVYTPEGERFTYQHVTPDMAKRIIVSHSMYGECIKEWLLKG